MAHEPTESVPAAERSSEDEDLTQAPTVSGSERRPFKTRLLNEIRTHPFGYSVLGIFLVAGPLLAPFLFPQAPPAAAVVGGLAFAVYAAVSAVPQKFL